MPWGPWAIRTLALTYLTAMLVIPVAVVLRDGLRGGLGALFAAIGQPVAAHALFLTFWTAALMTAINAVFGTLTAWVLVRYRFPGRRLLDAVVDVPFAVPTLVAGVMLVLLYGPEQPAGAWLARHGHPVLFAPPGIVLALLFVTFPLVVRSVQPVLRGLDRQEEEAAATLGAGGWTIFRRVVLPAIALPVASGTLLAFARAVGEFGAIVVVAGNIPMRTQTAAVYVFGEIESDNPAAASAVSIAMLAVSASLVFVVDRIQRRGRPAPQ